MQPETHFLKAIQSPWYRALVQLEDTLTAATVGFWTQRGVRYGYLPLTTSAVSSPMGLGSDSKPVAVNMFGVETFLADSMQFGLEYLCRMAPAGAYYLMPSFRGEPVDETHLSQFMHSEAELPASLDVIMDVAEDYLRRICGDLAASCPDLIAHATGALTHLDRVVGDPSRFSRVTFEDAAGVLNSDPRWIRTEAGWRTLTRAGERELMARCGQFLWVTHWDQMAVPFYQAVDDAGRALNADLLFGPGEVIGAGQRHTTGEQVADALRTHGVAAENYDWYVEMKHVAPMETSGFGLGIERFLMWLLQHDDIRDMQIFPRENGRQISP